MTNFMLVLEKDISVGGVVNNLALPPTCALLKQAETAVSCLSRLRR